MADELIHRCVRESMLDALDKAGFLDRMTRFAHADDAPMIDGFDPFAGDRAREIAEGRMLVVEVSGGVAAYVSWLPGGFVGRDYVTFLCVRPDHRRQGLAASLLRATEERLAGGRLFISTEEDNEAMLALLSREGWTYAGGVAGANEDGRAELFFHKNLAGPDPRASRPLRSGDPSDARDAPPRAPVSLETGSANADIADVPPGGGDPLERHSDGDLA